MLLRVWDLKGFFSLEIVNFGRSVVSLSSFRKQNATVAYICVTSLWFSTTLQSKKYSIRSWLIVPKRLKRSRFVTMPVSHIFMNL